MNAIVNTASVKPVKTPNQKRQTRLALIVLAVLIGAVAVAYQFIVPSSDVYVLADYDSSVVTEVDLKRTAQASGTTQIPNQMIIPSPQEGYTRSVLVTLGETVTKNQVIAVITVPDLDEKIEDLEAELLSDQLALKRLVLQYNSNIDNSDANLVTLDMDLLSLQSDVAKYKKLVAINSARLTELEAVEDDYSAKSDELADAKRDRLQTEALHLLDLASAEASIKQTKIRLARAIAEKEETNIKSPMDGEILEIQDVMNVPGSTLEIGTELLTIADPSSTVFDLEISEEYASSIAIGDTVPVTIGSSKIPGTITSIGKVAQSSSDGLGASVQVIVTPVTNDGGFLLGSTAIGVFTLGVEQNALTLPRGSYLTTGAQKYVYVINGDRAVKTNVTFGEIEGNTVQIISGIKAGDRVITSGYQNFISQSEIKLAGE